MILLINGPHGVGKTSVANYIKKKTDKSCIIMDSDFYYKKMINEDFYKAFGTGTTPQTNSFFIGYFIKQIQKRKEHIKIIPFTFSNPNILDLFKNNFDTKVIHIVLQASSEDLENRIFNDKSRDKEFAISENEITNKNIGKLENNLLIDTSSLKADEVADIIIKKQLSN